MNQSPAEAGRRIGWLADCHAHLHDRFSVDDFFDGAADNFEKAANHVRAAAGSVGCLFLVDTPSAQGFRRLQHEEPSRWTIQATDEATALLAYRDDSTPIAVISGIQVTTRERLEVLVLGVTADVPDGESIIETVDRALALKGLVGIPWGFGKWSATRGVLVEKIMCDPLSSDLFLGDNGNRLTWLPTPRLLRKADDLALKILPGSDPLPLPFHQRRVGQAGVFLRTMPSLTHPTKQLVNHLKGERRQPETYWHPEPVSRFVYSQVAMQIRRVVRNLS